METAHTRNVEEESNHTTEDAHLTTNLLLSDGNAKVTVPAFTLTPTELFSKSLESRLQYRNRLQTQNYASLMEAYQQLLHNHIALTANYYQLEKEKNIPRLHSPCSSAPTTPINSAQMSPHKDTIR
jgi:hypothetical protein